MAGREKARPAGLAGLRWAAGIPILPPIPVLDGPRDGESEREEAQLHLRGPDRMRPGAPVRAGERAAALATDADVRPDREDRRYRRAIRQGRGRGRTRRQAGAVVLRLPFQKRSRDAWLPAARFTVAAPRLLPWLDESALP